MKTHANKSSLNINGKRKGCSIKKSFSLEKPHIFHNTHLVINSLEALYNSFDN